MNERELFLSALEIEDPAVRRAHLQTACAGDADLLARVESLLASHKSDSQFVNSPVVDQIGGVSAGGTDSTILLGNGSTQDDEPDTATCDSNGPEPANENGNGLADEIPLTYLQPSSRPGSLGRLAHYDILEVVGTGAFGTVLKAFDEKLQRVVAIKVLAPELAATSPARKRFLREARASAAVRHENVVSIYAVEDDPLPYLVMEYIPGQTLQQRLDDHGPLELPHALRLGKQIADGLAAAHAQQLIHRDIKPGNILLETSLDDHVKITDFGLALTADDASLTQSGMIVGTPMYAAPEQALGQKLDQRADLFSFGSVLYQMLSGRPPFRAPTTVAVLTRVVEDRPRPIREIIPEVPCWMCQFIGHLHAKNPDHRYGTAQEVSDLLAQCLADVQAGRKPRIPHPSRPGDDRAGNRSEKTRLWGVRHLARRPSAAAAAVAILLMAGLAITESTGITQLITREGRTGVRMSVEPTAAAANSVVTKPPPSLPFQWPADAPPPAIAPFDAERAKHHQQAWADYLGVPVEQDVVLGQDKDGNDVKLTLVLIPPGEFLMGSPEAERQRALEEARARNDDWALQRIPTERPHRVTLTRPFYLGKYEVTQAQWQAVTKSNPSRFKDPANPVETVSWDEIQSFLEKLNSATRRRVPSAETARAAAEMTYALPTEAQWEYACRAGTTTAFCSSDTAAALGQYAWFRSNSGGRTHPVGSLKANAWGLYDMHGNVWEKCADRWGPLYYAQSPSTDPPGPVEGSLTVHRGGSFFHTPGYSRSARRDSREPGHPVDDIGIRLAAALPTGLIRAKTAPESPPETPLSGESVK